MRRYGGDIIWKSTAKQLNGANGGVPGVTEPSFAATLAARLARSLGLAALAVMAAVATAAAQQGGPVAQDLGGLTLTPPAERPAATLFDWSWTEPGNSKDAAVTLSHFTPRLSGLALSLPDGQGGLGPSGSGDSGSGVGFDYKAGTISGNDVAVTVGAGFASRSAPSLGFTEPLRYDTAGLGGRVRISRVSLGSALLGTRASRLTAGPGSSGISGGYDLDLSYSFQAGTLSLQRSVGASEEVLGQRPDRGHDTVALSGRYLAGPSLDMTAWVGFSGANDRGAVQSEFDGWALVTGLHLSF